MTDRDKLLFIIANDQYPPSWLASKTGWSKKKVHNMYQTVWDCGLYKELREIASPEVQRNWSTTPQQEEKNIICVEFAERLKRLVKKNGKPVKETADDLKLSYDALNKFMNAKRLPNKTNLARIADYFHVTVDWLVSE